MGHPHVPVRFEVLPFGRAEADAAATSGPLTLTVTCSPQHGMDSALDVACSLRRLGHTVVLHLAARMVRGPEHLDVLLDRMHEAGITDVFLVGGDAPEPLGPYASGVELIKPLRAHPRAPRTIGVPAYPEGHPLIDRQTLSAALRAKAPHADYMTSQICFDHEALLHWLESARADGIDLPLYVGVPGAVDRRRLLEISLRVGVGASVRFVRKQRGIAGLLRRPADGSASVVAAVLPLVGTDLGIAGFQFFTFNRLVATTQVVDQWLSQRPALGSERRRRHP